jgi:predicted MFS family arabinose efflux permease
VLSLGFVLAGLGASVGTLDVAMNIAAVTVIRQTGRPMMPVFHAAFSFGGMAGAAGAALASAIGAGITTHFALVAALTAVVALAVTSGVPNEPRVGVTTGPAPVRASLARRPVLWLLAAVALFSSVAEGGSADWSALFAVRERGLSETTGALVYTGFSVAMALTRLVGERAERRWGSDRLLQAGALTAGFGLLLAVCVPATWSSFAGFALAGIGLAYAFPTALGMASAAGAREDGSGGERELGFVTSIAYSGFLIGPPLIGGIAQASNLAVALGVAGGIAMMIAPAAFGAAAARRREQAALVRSTR